ncbi:MAG: choice-of-anchor D domain-containing protein, partial [Phycisphaerales bacterium]|nr:choice-of-anchor D domain-containing protein [Phycisphaerales bacterium]
AYSVHFMSQGGDAARRALEALRIKNNANGIDTNPGDSSNPAGSTAKPAAYACVLGGDTNIQTASDQAWVNLTGSSTVSTGPFFDPIRASGSWNNNSNFRFLHTQDPRVTGMDDRFDVLLISASLKDGAGLDYIGNTLLTYSNATWNDPNHSYRCWGNDGGAYGVSLRTTANTMVGPSIAQALIDTTNDGGSSGGHLPVFADFRVPAVFASSTGSVAFGQVVQGDAASAVVTITNAGDVSRWTVNGVAPLRYTMSITGPFTVSGAGAQQTEAPGGGGNAHTVTMDTSTPGAKSGSITITTDAPDTPTFTILLAGDVQPPAPTCTADLGHQGGLPGPDGQLDNNDFIAFIAAFFAQDAAADLGHQGGLPGGDGAFDNNDFIAFIAAFFAGCP